MDSSVGAYGAGKAQGPFDPLELVQRPPVILRLVNIVSAIFRITYPSCISFQLIRTSQCCWCVKTLQPNFAAPPPQALILPLSI